MVFVPSGTFTMGSDGGNANEQPMHTIALSAYWIDRNAVTVDAYADCLNAGACTVPDGSLGGCNWGVADRGDHPINCVDWSQALAYCSWAGKRLPTEAEWEKAARGPDAWTYPWGEEVPTCDYAVMNDPNAGGVGCGSGSSWPVGSKRSGMSPYGALDMAGNIFQWVNDWYSSTYYSVSPSTDPLGPSTGSFKIQRGGGWGTSSAGLRSAYRFTFVPAGWFDLAGFRCARDG